MRQSLKDILKEQKELIYLTTITILIYVLLFAVLQRPFLVANDQQLQYNIFYKEWINLIRGFIKGNGAPFYSWNMYLGTDFYSSMGYYCTGDIFLPILLVFRNNIEIGLLIETILCFYISAFGMNVLLNTFGVNKKRHRVLLSWIYAFAGQASIYVGNYMFHRFYAFLPLLLLGLLKYFDSKDRRLFTVSSAILFLQNYYLMFPTLLFILFFSIAEEVHRKRLNCIWKDFIMLLRALIIGFLISAIITLPSMLYIINNPRITENYSNNILWDRNVYYGLYMTLTSINMYGTNSNIFYTTHEVHDNFYCLYISIIPLIASLSFCLNKDNKPYLFLLISLLLIMIIRPLNSIMHGFSIPSLRWVFLVNIYLLMLAGKGIEEIDKKRFLVIGVCYFVGYVALFYDAYIRNYINIWGMMEHVYLLCISLLLSIIILISFIKSNKTWIYLTVLFITLSNLFYAFKISEGYEDVQGAIKPEVVGYYKSQDTDAMYRYYQNYKNNTPNSNLNKNQSLIYNLMSTATYSSTYDAKIEKLNNLANASDGIDWNLQIDDPYINAMLGMKYWIVYKEDELPKELDFEYAYNFDYLQVYKYKDFSGFGFATSNTKYLKDLNNNTEFLDTIFIDNENDELISDNKENKTPFSIIKTDNNSFEGTICVEDDSILMIPIPNNAGWNIKVNGEKINTISVNGGLMGIRVNKGKTYIEACFVPYGLKASLILTTAGLLLLFRLIIKRKEN